MKITKFDRPSLKFLRGEIDTALKAVADKHDIVLKLGNISFSGNNASMKVEASVKNASGEVITKEAEDFKRQAMFYGLEPSDLGKTVTMRGQKYTICGLKPKSTKYPILAKRGDGAVVKVPLDMIKRALGK